jgi:hypothetical protein
LLRVGLFLLRRPLPPCTDWVYLLDLTIQLEPVNISESAQKTAAYNERRDPRRTRRSRR